MWIARLQSTTMAGKLSPDCTDMLNRRWKTAMAKVMIFDELIGAVGLDAVDTRIVEDLADEASTRFESDAAAVRYFVRELQQRHPRVWMPVQELEEFRTLQRRAHAN